MGQARAGAGFKTFSRIEMHNNSKLFDIASLFHPDDGAGDPTWT